MLRYGNKMKGLPLNSDEKKPQTQQCFAYCKLKCTFPLSNIVLQFGRSSRPSKLLFSQTRKDLFKIIASYQRVI